MSSNNSIIGNTSDNNNTSLPNSDLSGSGLAVLATSTPATNTLQDFYTDRNHSPGLQPLYTHHAHSGAHEHIDGLMDPPAEGYHAIQGITLRSVLQNIDNASYRLWNMYADLEPGLLAYIPHDQPQGDSTLKTSKIADVVRSAFPAQSNVQVAAPMFTDAGDGQIYPFWITGLTYQQVETLLARMVWSTPAITFICIPLHPFSTGYIMTVENLSHSVDADGEVKAATVINVIKEGMKANRTLLHFIRRHMSAILDDPIECLLDVPTFPALTPKSILTHAIESVQTRGQTVLQGGTTIEVFHIYMKPFTNDPDLLDQWIARLKAARYLSESGTAIVRDSFTCTYCIGHDHPTALCPLLDSTHIHALAE